MRRTAAWAALGAALAISTMAPAASAYSTRVHIVIANKVREALIASGGTSIQLQLSPYAVTLSPADAQALVSQPLAFRAGAIGPDNMIFPAMTDPSHAIEERPFEQCKLLYDAAVDDEERAYAMGCFLHGSTDAVAHHFVNYLTGETFTLTPISASRQQSWDNVVRHVTAESMIQKSALALDPSAFDAGQMAHAIPKGFLLRTYLDPTSDLYAVMGKLAKERYDAAVLANPGASLPTLLASSNLSATDHLVLAPVYLAELEAARQQLRADVQSAIALMQSHVTVDGSQLWVTPGPDGTLGTKDDGTSCAWSCPDLYAKYFTYVGLMEPRYDAQNNPLPSAFDKISDKLKSDLAAYLPAQLATVENISAKLNGALLPGASGLDLSKSDLPAMFAPMRAWASDVTTIDFETVSQATVPGWIISVQDAVQSVGISVQISDVLKALFDPIVQPVKDAVEGYVIDTAETYVGDLVDSYQAGASSAEAEFQARLDAAAGPGLSGQPLDHFFTSGLYAHSFNIAAAALARHEIVLPVGQDPVGIGPASFDASHTPSWMQAGVCDYLREAIFPLGIDVRGSLSVRESADFPANVGDDSPVECHDGSLAAFTTQPTVEACALTVVDALVADPAHRGSVSRAYPPAWASAKPPCLDLEVPGLPKPAAPDGGAAGGLADAGGAGSGGAGGSGGDPAVPGAGPPTQDAGSGCGCRTAKGSGESMGAWMGLGVAMAIAAGRRRRSRALACAAATAAVSSLAALALGCSGGDSSPGYTGLGGGGGDGAAGADSGPGEDASSDGAGGDAIADGPVVDAPAEVSDGPTASALLAALGQSVWHGMGTRGGKSRGIELRFRASSLEWAEIQNPYGPSRKRELRVFTADPDAKTVHTTVLTPAGWPTNPDNGKKDTYELLIVDGSPRQLFVTNGATTEQYDEGPWPAPTSGLTAIATAFESGTVSDAFCTSGLNGFDYATIFDFARGKSSQPVLATDVVAGARLLTWHDGTQSNQFAITDVDGFDQLGGTDMSDQFNFFVRYVGTVKSPGGNIFMRELDDSVEDGVWAFLDTGVGSSNVNDLFLEVQGFAWPDKTANVPSAYFGAGDVPIEIIVVRCAKQIKDVDVQLSFDGVTFAPVGDAPTTPQIDDTLFPPAL